MKTKRLTIFEGPDGSGKSTAAQKFAEETGALFVHHGPYPAVSTSAELAEIYVASMRPALNGERDVVLDRCWLSEAPYAEAFRDGALRLDVGYTRMLERLALSCATALVLCLPKWERVRQNFEARRAEEYLKREDQLRYVYERYATLRSALPTMLFDFETGPMINGEDLDDLRSDAHETDFLRSAGVLYGPVLLVGEGFGPTAPSLPFPFGAWTGAGCSHWLACTLEGAGIGEEDLCWANQDTPALPELCAGVDTVIALGVVASAKLEELGVEHDLAPHPAYWRRFKSAAPYPLIRMLKEYLW